MSKQPLTVVVEEGRGVLMRSQLLTLEVTSDQGVVTIRCQGEIDLSNSAELWDAIEWSVTADLTLLRVDMRRLGFLDWSGVATLLSANRKCARCGARFEVLPSSAVRRVIEVLDVWVPLVDAQPETAPT